jgi:hypothetical protein
MVAIDSAQFSGTNGSMIPSGTPFYLNLTMRNTSVLDQEYNIKVIYSDGDPSANGTKIASVVAAIPSAAVGGAQRVTIPLNVTAPEGFKMKLYAVVFPRCPMKRMPEMDCSNLIYPLGTLTVTREAGQGYGVVFPDRVWEGSALPRGTAFAAPGGMYKGGTNYNPPGCNVKFKIPESVEEYQRLLSRAQRGMSDEKSLAEGGPEVGLVFPQETGEWNYCASERDPIGYETQERWVSEIYDAAYRWWDTSHVAAPCICESNCFKPGDPALKNAQKSHTDRCGNIIVDQWCPTCESPKCSAQKPAQGVAKTYLKDACGNYVITEFCPTSCPRSPEDPILQARFPGSKILDFTKDTCNCVIPRVRQISASEVSALNKTIEKVKNEQVQLKSGTTQPKAGRLVIAKRTVTVPEASGFAMAVEHGGVLPIFAPDVRRKR